MDKSNIDFDAISSKVTEELISKVNGDDSYSEIAKIIITTSVKSTIAVLKEYNKLINS